MNVQAVWSRGYAGQGVVVTILDDGLETDHPDLRTNYVSFQGQWCGVGVFDGVWVQVIDASAFPKARRFGRH